ncbi:MAG: hypothetical protein K8L99_15560, partial [Anaerolineae bacterium]|nr:hypothetical protein [Anaerolineae bacterium]
LGLVVGALITYWFGMGQRIGFGVPVETPIADLGPALQAFNRGNLDTAIDLSQRLLAIQPDNIGAVMVLARALIYRSYSDYNYSADRDSAQQITQEMIEQFPKNADALAIHAFALQANGQPATAAGFAQTALEIDPNHGLARTALALSYSGVGSHDTALRESLLAVEDPGWKLDTYRALALSYSGVGEYQKALEAVKEASRYNLHLLALYFEQALYARQLGNADEASVAYFQVLAYAPDNVKARLRLCELSSLLRERDSAIQFCTQVTELAPEWSEGWYQLGREYFLQGNLEAAQSHLNRCSTLQVMQDVPVSERRFECWYIQGQAAEILGDCPALLATYNEYRSMALDAGLSQTWIYPPEGPPGCTPTTVDH